MRSRIKTGEFFYVEDGFKWPIRTLPHYHHPYPQTKHVTCSVCGLAGGTFWARGPKVKGEVREYIHPGCRYDQIAYSKRRFYALHNNIRQRRQETLENYQGGHW